MVVSVLLGGVFVLMCTLVFELSLVVKQFWYVVCKRILELITDC